MSYIKQNCGDIDSDKLWTLMEFVFMGIWGHVFLGKEKRIIEKYIEPVCQISTSL